MVNCDGLPFTWPGAGGNLQRELAQAGKLAGFGTMANTTEHGAKAASRNTEISNHNPVYAGGVKLARDAWGLVFPGCVYLLVLSPRPVLAHGSYQHRVVLHGDGTITHASLGSRVATWSFAATTPLSSGAEEPWAIGDSLVLEVEGALDQVRRFDRKSYL